MRVPFIDLKSQNEFIKDEINTAIKDVIDCCAFAGGPFVEKFEKEFADFCQCREAIGVGSGTAALWLSLLALGIGSGDEVITVPNTFIATAEAISFCGAKPVFVDIDEHSYNMDPLLLENAITPKTKAIIPVHLNGQMADMDPIMEIAKRHNLFVVEDACQAHGAEYKKKKAGSIGHAGCFSFYPGKNLGAFGEAGAVVTNDKSLADRIRMMRDHGQNKKYIHAEIGWNSRMDGIQGAVLSVKLKHLESWNKLRQKHADIYDRMLADIDQIVTPHQVENRSHIYHIYPIRNKNRDALIEVLREKDIHCGIHYPVPIHLQKAYWNQESDNGHFPVTEQVTSELISLPMFPELTDSMIKIVCKEIEKWSSNVSS